MAKGRAATPRVPTKLASAAQLRAAIAALPPPHQGGGCKVCLLPKDWIAVVDDTLRTRRTTRENLADTLNQLGHRITVNMLHKHATRRYCGGRRKAAR